MADPAKIHSKCSSEKIEDRIEALNYLFINFSNLPRNRALRDLVGLTQDDNRNVRRGAALALRKVINQVNVSEEVWQDLIMLTEDKDWNVRREAAVALTTAFANGQVKRNQSVWQDFFRLTQSGDWNVRLAAVIRMKIVLMISIFISPCMRQRLMAVCHENNFRSST